jgi:hypothetical protein
MCSEVFTEELLKDRGDVLANLLLHVFGESVPDAAGWLRHVAALSSTRAMNSWAAVGVSLVRACVAGVAARSVELRGMRSRSVSR